MFDSILARPIRALAAAAALAIAPAALAQQEFLIGVVNPMTGPGADLGVSGQQAIDPWVEEINKAGGINGMKVRVIYRDDQSNPKVGVQAVTELIQREKVHVMMGLNLTHVGFAVSPIINQAKVPFIVMGIGDVLIDAQKFPYSFRLNLSNSMEAQTLVDHAVRVHKMKAPVFLVDNTALGQSGNKALTDALAKHNLKPAAVESFGLSDTDMTGQLLNLKKTNPDVLFVWGLGPTLAHAARSAERIGFTIPTYGGFGTHQEGFINLAGPAGKAWSASVYRAFTHSDKEPAPAPLVAFIERQKKIYGAKVSPSIFISATWDDSLRLLTDAVKRAKSTNGEAIRAALEDTRNFKGLITTYNFSKAQHDGHDPKDVSISYIMDIDNFIRRRLPTMP